MNQRTITAALITLPVALTIAACGGSGNSESAVKACSYTREALASLDAMSTISFSQSAVKYAGQADSENHSKYAVLASASVPVWQISNDYSYGGAWTVRMDGALLDMNAVCVDLGEPQYR